ncbi:MAG: hypothetical protein QOF56_1219 [Acidobacteriaceae bacterium]|jgi:hypothetical protein|nr:hypothetical protein [Acidobacteriaceae bacterium]
MQNVCRVVPTSTQSPAFEPRKPKVSLSSRVIAPRAASAQMTDQHPDLQWQLTRRQLDDNRVSIVRSFGFVGTRCQRGEIRESRQSL